MKTHSSMETPAFLSWCGDAWMREHTAGDWWFVPPVDATVLDKHGFFDVGRKNYLSLQKALWKSGLALDAECIGGVVARSLRLDVGSGDLWIKEGDQTDWRSFPVRNENAGQENIHVATYSRPHR